MNYGSFLQTIATQKILADLGFEVTILDYIRPDEEYKNVTKLLLSHSAKWNNNIFSRCIYRLIHEPDHIISGKAFEKQRNKYLHLSKRISNFAQQKNEIPEAQYYCTGSDQVWGEIGSDDYDAAYFLDFVDEKKATCVAFASSFGKNNYPDSRMDMFKELLKKYNKITVREKSAIHIVEKAGRQADIILDPTLIVSRNYWETFDITRKIKQRYVLLYQLNTSKEMDKYASEFSKRLGLPLIRVSCELYNIHKVGNFKWCLSPFDFLSYIKYAEYLITDSFHGTVFAITFNKQFIEILPPDKKTRNINILEQFGLESRIVDDLDDYSYVESNIDYDSVNNQLEFLRKEALERMKNLFMEG